ncbi:MAG: endonuclease III [Chthoniobacterales bacterium]
MTRKERAAELTKRLPRIYPEAHCELDYKSPLDLLIATILSAQCTDKRVNIVTQELFKVAKTASDYADISQAALEKIIHSTGFYRNKAKNIRAAAVALIEKHDGKVPRNMDSLAALPGVGRKTANVVLGNAFDINDGIVVDTHVGRLSRRLHLTKHNDAVKIENDLVKLIPRDNWCIFSHWLIWHGRRRCMARNPDCKNCELRDICPSADKVLTPIPKTKSKKAKV